MITEAVTSSCQLVLAPKMHTHKHWITKQTLEKIAERTNRKAALDSSHTRFKKINVHAAYAEANKMVKGTSELTRDHT